MVASDDVVWWRWERGMRRREGRLRQEYLFFRTGVVEVIEGKSGVAAGEVQSQETADVGALNVSRNLMGKADGTVVLRAPDICTSKAPIANRVGGNIWRWFLPRHLFRGLSRTFGWGRR